MPRSARRSIDLLHFATNKKCSGRATAPASSDFRADWRIISCLYLREIGGGHRRGSATTDVLDLKFVPKRHLANQGTNVNFGVASD